MENKVCNKCGEVDWSLYKGVDNSTGKQAYIRFYNNIFNVEGKLLSEYKGSEYKTLISLNNNVEFWITPHCFNNKTYRVITSFKDKLSKNNEKFIEYVKYVENVGLTAKIKTIHDIVIPINIGSYDSFVKSRKETEYMALEIGFNIKEYVSNSEDIIIYNDNVAFKTTPNRFKVQTYKNAKSFINSLKCGDIFIGFVGCLDEKCLIARIKNKFGEYQDLPMSTYKIFNSGREVFYKFCEKNNYKVLSGYNGNTREVLVDAGCKHGEFRTTPKLLMRCKFRCPKCVTFKGENNPNWNPNKTQEDRENDRSIAGYTDFIIGVYKRDKHTCQYCKIKGNGHNLNAHHLNGYNWDVENRINVDNGITLCEGCHKDFHRMYGKGNNTKEQYNEWVNNKKENLESAV